MSSTDDITSLPGYEELQEAAIAAIEKRVQGESPWVFENESDVELSEMLDSYDKGRQPHAWSRHEILEALFDGRYHDAVQQMNEQWHSDGDYDRDCEWTKEQLEEAIDAELAPAIQAFCDQHGLDEDEVHEALKDDDEIRSEGGLHYTTFKFRDEINFKVDLGVTAGLQPSEHLVRALATLGIPANAWIEAITQSTLNDPPDSEDEFENIFNVSDIEQYRESFGKCQVIAAAANVFLPTDESRQLIAPDKLVDLYRGDWNGYTGDLHVCFKLDGDFIEDVSQAVSRLASGKEASHSAAISIKGAHLLPEDGIEYIEGVEIKGPVFCTLGELRMIKKNIDLPEVSTKLDGPLGLQTFIYERLLKADDESSRGLKGSFFATAVGRPYRNAESMTADLSSPVFVDLMEKAFNGKSHYDLDRCASFYPGLKNYFADAIELKKQEESSELLGQRLLHLLNQNTGMSLDKWKASEDRAEAAWLIEHGAALDARLDGRTTDACGPTALHLAASLADHDLCERLVGAGANPTSTFRMPGDDACSRQGLWEIIARRAIANDDGGKNESLALCLRDMAVWSERQGAIPLSFEQFGPRGTRVNNWRCLAAINERNLVQSHIEREQAVGPPEVVDEQFRRAMHFALCRPAPCVAIPLIDAGVSIDAPSPDHVKAGLSLRQAALNWRSSGAHRPEDTVGDFDSMIQYAESKNALDIIKRIAKWHAPKPN